MVALPIDLPYKIRKHVPKSPNKIPRNFRIIIFSFMIMEDKINTIIGVVTIITAAEIGEVKLNPLKKVSHKMFANAVDERLDEN